MRAGDLIYTSGFVGEKVDGSDMVEGSVSIGILHHCSQADVARLRIGHDRSSLYVGLISHADQV